MDQWEARKGFMEFEVPISGICLTQTVKLSNLKFYIQFKCGGIRQLIWAKFTFDSEKSKDQ